MSGSIWFKKNTWAYGTSPIMYVLEFLAERLPPGGFLEEVKNNIATDAPYLYLDKQQHAPAVNLIADELPKFLATIADTGRREALERAFEELIELAHQQQKLNNGLGVPE